MAEGGEVAGRYDNHGCVSCSPCSRKDHAVPAVKYCIRCETFFCKQCLNIHDVMFDFHTVRDAGDSFPLKDAMVGHTSMDTCEEHFKVVDMYCQDEDVVGCTVCMTIDHRSCQRIHYIPKSAEELVKKADIKEIELMLATNIRKLESIKVSQQATQEDLDESQTSCLDELEAHSIKLHERLDNVLKESRDAIDIRFESLRTEAQFHFQTVDTHLANMKAVMRRLRECHDNVVQTFIEIKKCQKMFRKVEPMCVAAMQNNRIKGVDVFIDKRLENLLSELHTLASIKRPLRVKKRREVNVKVGQDLGPCNIFGTCVINDGSVLLADWKNCRLKRVRDTGNESWTVEQCSLDNKPTDVCKLGGDEVVVAKGKSLAFVALRPRYQLIRTVTFDDNCVCMTSCNGELFVSDEKANMGVYNPNAHFLRTVSLDSSEQNLFSNIRHVAVNENGDKMYFADYGNGLITADLEGNILGTIVPQGVRGTCDMCSDGSGGMFVCGHWSHNVIHISRRGDVLGELLTADDGLRYPRSIAYDIKNKRLYVTNNMSNNLLVFEMK